MSTPTSQFKAGDWVRECQECGHKQTDPGPKSTVTTAFTNHKCKRCKSPALDWGSVWGAVDDALSDEEGQ